MLKSILLPTNRCCTAILLVLTTACGGSTQDTSPTKSTMTSTASKPATSVAAKTEDTAHAPAKSTNATAANSAAPSGATNEDVRPSAEEWAKGQPGDIERAGELGCQVTVVREWVRIACGPKTTKGARIIDISVFLECKNGSCTSHPERGYIQGGQRILEEPLREGDEIKANFVWENGAEELRLEWPKGRPKPAKLGAFTTNPDIDPATLRPQLRAIECCIQVQGEKTCLGRADGYAAGPCFKAFQKDCKKLVACQMGELPPPCASSPNGCDE